MRRISIRAGFWTKLGLAVVLIALADLGIYQAGPGAGLAAFALGCIAAVALASPAVRRNRLSRAALAAALVFAVLQIETFSPLGWLLFCLAVGVAALAPRAPRGADARVWALRLAIAALRAVPAPLIDAGRIRLIRRRRGLSGARMSLSGVAATVLPPLAGGLVFFGLFALANPLIASALRSFRLGEPDVPRLVFWGAVGGAAWALLRPRGVRQRVRRFVAPRRASADPTALPAATIVLSLAVFNAVFALQNGLDLAFLWSGAALPPGMTFAAYAHRGAYVLVLTALLAGGFVLMFLRPGAPAATSRAARILVVVWVAQNILLLASTVLRTLDYVQAYSLTRLRIAALVWMALVATGLLLICWRLLRDRSSSWLINANALAAALVLAVSSIIDYGALAAAWNVRHAAELGGRGAALDVGYLEALGPAAIVSLAELEEQPLPAELHRQVVVAEGLAVAELRERQASWQGWSWRGARRLARAQALIAEQIPRPAADLRPLTPAAQPRS